MNNRQLHVDEISMLKKEAAKLATQNGQMNKDGYEYWFTLSYSVAYGKVDTNGREQLLSMAKQWDQAGKETNDFSLQQLSKNISFASKIVDSMAGKTITDNSNKPIIENGSIVQTFKATDAQKNNSSLFGYDLKTAGLKAKDDPKNYGSSGVSNKLAQGTVKREHEDLVEGLERGSKGVVPVYPEIELIGTGKLAKETAKSILEKQAAKKAEQEAIKKQSIENNFYTEGDSLYAKTQIELKNKAAQIRSSNSDMFDINGKPLGNLATGTIRIDGLPVQEVKAFSRYGDNVKNRVDGYVGLSNKDPILKPISNPRSAMDRAGDTEYKILESFAQTYKNKPNVKGSIDLFTERAPCKSCTNVIQEQFSHKYPNVQVRVYHDNGNYSIYQG
ncbi:MAG: hypothetical protein H9855_12380 [Candidatus Acinetobacter avistercoris]|nr:hypothetical protein [Candidatus Acinetobacter avistercoris]